MEFFERANFSPSRHRESAKPEKWPADPGAPKRPIRFRVGVRTGHPLLGVSQNLPVNEATGHPPPVECKQTKKSIGSRNELSPIVHCALHAQI